MGGPDVRVSATPSALAAALGDYVCAAAVAAVAARGRFVVALSGGSLPQSLGDALAAAAARGVDARTDAWHVFYADERVVPLDDADSNHAAAKAALFDKARASAVLAARTRVPWTT